ncbi:hypothetical protein MKEN_00698500 [Mycena kentingensis (nom. inval.)]|nr:hypothetical protein MKEN_00698500 [Mycena kentingensis (nom. inval.)]
MGGHGHFRVGYAGAVFNNHASKNTKRADSAAADPSCATGAFYQAPALGSSVDSMTPLSIVWNPSLNCLQPTPSLVDIYLDNPGNSRLHLWEGVPYAAGNYTVNMLPRWWNATATANLQILVVPNGVPTFLSTIPAGPVFEATYTNNGTTPPAADVSIASTSSDTTTVVTVTSVSGVSSHHMSAGKKAAAVLLPLLFVILLGLAYLKISRARGAAKRSEWSEKLDKRMSTISADWKSMTGAGAKEAVRQSMARNSMAFSFGSIRTPNVEGDPVVMGEKPLPVPRASLDVTEKDLPRTSLGTGVGVRPRPRNPSNASPPDRTSRAVSFADAAHPRPSVSSIYSRNSRAFHVGSTYNDFADSEAPPVPALPSPSRISAYGEAQPRKSSSSNNGNRVTSIYTHHTGGAWSSGERVEGVDGGYGARSVSPTGRVHTINYPSAMQLSMASPQNDNFAYGDHEGAGSYFSPITPTAGNAFSAVYAENPSAASAYGATTFDAPPEMTSPRQTAGPLTLTPEDIRRRMTANNGPNGDGAWRQSVDEVFGALSMMRTGGPSSPETEDTDEYLFAPTPETVFAYPGTPAASSFNSAAPSSPFAMPMSSVATSSSPDAMLRAYATKHMSVASNAPSTLSNSTAGAEVVSSLHNTGMRVLYTQQDGQAAAPTPLRKSTLIRAGKGARLSK